MTAAQEPKERNRVVAFALSHWLAIVLVVLAAVFVGQNTNRVSIDVLSLSVKAPLWLVLVVMVLVGMGISTLWTWHRGRKPETSAYPESAQSPSERAGRARKSAT
jgi:uncharacterized integral membrane protein